MSNKTRFFTIVLGVTALAGLTYGVTRRSLPRRAVHPHGNHPLAGKEIGVAAADDAAATSSPDWETLHVHSTRGSTPDVLDIAMNLDGIFDVDSEVGGALTVRPSEHVPLPLGGDDEEARSADDLGRAWLAQATQAEHSVRPSDLTPDLDNLLALDSADTEELDAEELDAEETDPADEHEDFRRTRA